MCPWAPGPAGSADFLDIWRKRLTRPRPGQLPFRSPREWAGAGPEGKGTLRKVGTGRRFSAERARSNLGDGQRARRKRQASEQSPVSAEETEAASSSSTLVQKSLKSAEEESGGGLHGATLDTRALPAPDHTPVGTEGPSSLPSWCSAGGQQRPRSRPHSGQQRDLRVPGRHRRLAACPADQARGAWHPLGSPLGSTARLLWRLCSTFWLRRWYYMCFTGEKPVCRE